MDSFASRVKSRRDELGLTQGEVAKLSGLKQPDISKIERGLILQTTELLGLAKALKCNPYWLESGQGSQAVSAMDVFPALDNHLLKHLISLAALLQAIPKESIDAAYLSASQALIGHLRASQIAAKPPLSPLGHEEGQS